MMGENGTTREAIKVLMTFEGLRRKPASEAKAGELVAIAGIEDVRVGDTLADADHPVALPRIRVEEPTIKIRVGVNTSPMAGKCKLSKFLTSRHIKDRLERETRKNLAIRVEPTDSADTFWSTDAASSSSRSCSSRCAGRATRSSSATRRS
jgi:GTP-binding protein